MGTLELVKSKILNLDLLFMNLLKITIESSISISNNINKINKILLI